jgi:hypothetical protein
MAEPNRLRDQVRPDSSSGLNPPPEDNRNRPPDSAQAERRQWTPRRIVLVAALGELLIVAACTLLIMAGPNAAIGVWGWLIANTVLGVWLALRGGGRQAWVPAIVGLVIAGVAAGVATAVAALLGILPESADAAGSNNAPALFGLLVAILVFIVGAPIVMVGAVVGSVAVDVRAERRHRAVARGEIPLGQPSGELERRSKASKPLDNLELAKVTADGAATRVIREYPLDPDPDALLGADAEQLAAIGYVLTSVERHPNKTGLGWRLIGVGLFVLDLALSSWSGAFLDTIRGRVIATFELQSVTHAPVAHSVAGPGDDAMTAGGLGAPGMVDPRGATSPD